jgi:type IV secretion system protein VirD4
MSQNASAARSPPSPKRLRLRVGVACKLSVLVISALILAQYVAGYVFLVWMRSDPQQASPLTIVRYGYYFGYRKDVRLRLQVASAVGLALVALGPVPWMLPRKRALHGEARFAPAHEIAEAGLFAPEGIVLGRVGGWGPFGGRYLILGGQRSASLTAEPRSGKGVSVVVPTLLSWLDSVVCADIKKENWSITAGFRRSLGHEVHLFDPLSRERRTSRWNPLDYVAEELGQRISDLQLIANMFIPDPPGADPFWASGGRTLFLGISLYLFATPGLPRTIGEILKQGMASGEEGFSHHWKRIIEDRQRGADPLPEVCVRALSDVIDLAPQTASSIRRTFTSKLELWLNPVLDAATAASDFDLRELRRRPISIYLGVMPKDLDRLAPLMSLFFQQAIALQTDELPEHNPALKHQVLMLLDEFPALGRLPILAKSAGFLPGYNVRTLMIMQSHSQLRDVYGVEQAKTLLKTVAARVYFAPKDMEDAQDISKELGDTTVKVRSISKPLFSLFDSGRRQGSVSTSEQRRALMLPQEVRDIGPQRQIVFAENVRPILCHKIRYFLLPVFLRRLRAAPQVPELPLIAPVARSVGASAVAGAATAAGAEAAAQKPTTRAATAVDIARIDELTMEDFDIDFDTVVLPEKAEGERLTTEELDTAVNSFINALRER